MPVEKTSAAESSTDGQSGRQREATSTTARDIQAEADKRIKVATEISGHDLPAFTLIDGLGGSTSTMTSNF